MSSKNFGKSLEKSLRPSKSQKKLSRCTASVLEESQIEDCMNYKSISGEAIVISASESSKVPEQSTDRPKYSNKFSCLPKKPKWFPEESAAEFQSREEVQFYKWRAELASMENSNSHIIMTPFERNLNIWRELWKAVEKADILFQVVDSRNPIFFYSEDLFEYCAQVNPSARRVVILNKADLLDSFQIDSWSNFFENIGVEHVFFSSFETSKENSSLVKTPSDLVNYIKSHSIDSESVASFIGYPNVGKSSTINSILGISKAAVSSTPGKTKHIQTFSTPNFQICDCPGLVFPQVATSKSELYLNGVLSVDQLREYLPPVALLVERISKSTFENVYNIKIILEHGISLAESVLSSYAKSRGYATSNFGNPDMARAARILLKDYNTGKLLFCHAPPGTNDDEFNGIVRCEEVPHEEYEPISLQNGSMVKVLSNKLSLNGQGKKHQKMNKRR